MMLNFKIKTGLTIAKLFLRQIIYKNKLKIENFAEEQNKKCMIYISPEDFNTINNGELSGDKIDTILKFAESEGFSCAYLLRTNKHSKGLLDGSNLINNPVLESQITFTSLYTSIKFRWKAKKSNEIKAQNKVLIKNSMFENFNWMNLERTLTYIKPRIIFSIGATQELLSVCKVLDVKVFEVMHGIFNEGDIPADWLNPTGFKPDLFLSWHDFYTEMLKARDVNALTVGHPNINLKPETKIRNKDSLSILVTLSNNIENTVDSTRTLDTDLYKQIKLIYSLKDSIKFRIHPVSLRKPIQFINDLNKWILNEFPSATIESPLMVNLSDSLSQVDLHLSKDSSTYFEAALIGIPSILSADLEKWLVPKEFITKNYVFQGGSLNRNDLALILEKDREPIGKILNVQDIRYSCFSWK
jgi:hypothetical protein